jgi:hypothetical protein
MNVDLALSLAGFWKEVSCECLIAIPKTRNMVLLYLGA